MASPRPISTPTLDPEQLRAAVRDADLRVLLMCLFHWTGDRRWIEPPYLPARDVQLIADPAAGFPEEIQREIREAVERQLAGGIPDSAIDDPGNELMCEMMSVCLGERVDAAYAPLVREDMGFTSGDVRFDEATAPEARCRLRVLIVGAGVCGIALAVKLSRLGIPYLIVEKNDEVGGTWYENRYPGCGVDTPNHAYSYSFLPNRWPHYFSARDEIQGYLARCASELGVRENIRFETTLEAARWDEQASRWQATVRSARGPETLEAHVLVSAIGQLNQPQMPSIPGLDRFGGPCFHSARWPRELDLAGKRVAVVGTGASAMQLVPSIADEVASLTVYQRSAQWARPIDHYHLAVSEGTQWLLDHVPHYASWFRFTLFWRYGDGLLPFLQKDPDWPHPERSLNRGNDRHRRELSEFIERSLEGRPDLLEKCLPSYPPYGKRMLIDNGWFETLRRSHVELVSESIDRAEPGRLVTSDGVEREADVVVLATGFQVTDMAARLGIHGREGRALAEAWKDENPTAYLGLTVPSFPNFFCMYGPNTNLGHGGSLIFHGECQARYITDCLVRMLEGGLGAIECRRSAHDAYVRRVDEAHEHMIWTHPGMSTWYRNAHGRVVSTSPWRLVDYWAMTHEADFAQFELTPMA